MFPTSSTNTSSLPTTLLALLAAFAVGYFILPGGKVEYEDENGNKLNKSDVYFEHGKAYYYTEE